MKYMTVKEASILWNMDVSNIGKKLRSGKIPGATKIGDHWMIPESAPRPDDNRTKISKQKVESDFFRFPLLVNFSESRYYPPLSKEESIIRKAEKDFLACNFDSARTNFDYLIENTENKYIRIMSLYFRCYISAIFEGGNNFSDYSAKFFKEFQEDFPHKKDMEPVISLFYSITAQYHLASVNLKIDPTYEYSPSVQPLIAYLSLFHLNDMLQTDYVPVNFDIYEITCSQLELNGYFYEASEFHTIMFIIYFSSLNEKAMYHHLRKCLDIAMEYDFILPATYYPYYKKQYETVLKDYPEEFQNKIKEISQKESINYTEFNIKSKNSSVFSLIADNEYRYIVMASIGYSNAKVAEALQVSERTVANKYSEIYEKIGIKGKKELIELMKENGIM